MRRWWQLVGVGLACCNMLSVAAGAPNTRVTPAARRLARILGGFHAVRSVSMHFICAKKLALFNHPILSNGDISLKQPDLVRFATVWPYRSVFILRGGVVFFRSQDDHRWHKAHGSRRWVVERVMQQFGRWSLGQTRNMVRDYMVRESVTAAPRPPILRRPSNAQAMIASSSGPRSAAAGLTFPHRLKLFTLTPKSAALRRAVRHIQIGFAPHQPQVRLILLQLSDGDVSCYWLTHIRINARLSADAFRPKGAP